MDERTDARHSDRLLGKITVNGKSIEVIDTKHGDYRHLQQNKANLHNLPNIITAIGNQELEHHFEEARKRYNPNQKDWRKQIDYTLAFFNVIDEVLVMVCLHPHLNRITIRTIVPEVIGKAANDVFGAYRIDNDTTKNNPIREIIRPSHLRLKQVLL